jgi:hypothetical protein
MVYASSASFRRNLAVGMGFSPLEEQNAYPHSKFEAFKWAGWLRRKLGHSVFLLAGDTGEQSEKGRWMTWLRLRRLDTIEVYRDLYDCSLRLNESSLCFN